MLDAQALILENPFYVLGLGVECSRADIEREGQKLLGMLELRLGQAARYETPLGLQVRTPERVRQAMASLRDPHRRLTYEVWARMPADQSLVDSSGPAPLSPAGPWCGARRALGWA